MFQYQLHRNHSLRIACARVVAGLRITIYTSILSLGSQWEARLSASGRKYPLVQKPSSDPSLNTLLNNNPAFKFHKQLHDNHPLRIACECVEAGLRITI